MANYPKAPQSLDQLAAKLQRVDAAVKMLQATTDLMKQCDLTEIHPTHVGQADRAVGYLESFASACADAFIQARKPK